MRSAKIWCVVSGVCVVAGLLAVQVARAQEADEKPAKPLIRRVSAGIHPSERPYNRKVIETLETKIVSFTFNEQPIKEALEYLQTEGGVNIVIDRSKLEDAGQTVTLKLTKVPVGIALKLLAEQIGLLMVVRDGIVFISDEEGVKMPPMTAVYDVRDLIMKPTVPGHNKPESILKDLIEIVRETIEPGTWDEGSGYAIRGFPSEGLIIVTHTPETHEKVLKLLEMIARAKSDAPVAPTVEPPKPITIMPHEER